VPYDIKSYATGVKVKIVSSDARSTVFTRRDSGANAAQRRTGRFLGSVALLQLVFPGPDDPEADRDLKRGLRSISPGTLRTFIVLAVLVQVGVFAASLGVLLVAFRGQRLVGGALAVGGVLSLVVSAEIYRRRRSRNPV